MRTPLPAAPLPPSGKAAGFAVNDADRKLLHPVHQFTRSTLPGAVLNASSPRTLRAASTRATGGRSPPCWRTWPGWRAPTPTVTVEARVVDVAHDLAGTFRAWARAASGTAARTRVLGDRYGTRLATARSQVYADAAGLLDEHDAEEAVAVIVQRAAEHQVLTAPIAGFDAAGLRYITARAWQYCASTVDPRAQLVQPEWE